MSFINGLSVKSPIETDSLSNTVIRKSTGLFKSVNTFLLSLLSVGLTQVLSSSLRSRKKIWSQCSEIQSGYELNFRHARFISYLFTILSQGILHFTPHGIHFNHDSRNSFLSNHDTQSAKQPDHGVTKIPLVPPRTLHLTIYLKHDSNDITL